MLSTKKTLIELFTYKKRLIYFANQFLGNEWSEDFVMEALDKATGIKDKKELKNFLYQTVRDSCLSYLRVFDRNKKFTDDQIEKFRIKAELMEELTEKPIK